MEGDAPGTHAAPVYRRDERTLEQLQRQLRACVATKEQLVRLADERDRMLSALHGRLLGYAQPFPGAR